MAPSNNNGARSVTSNQDGPYKDLEVVVRKYATTTFLRPIADHTRIAFAEAVEFVDSFHTGLVVLDSGCGTGESTLHLAKRFPNYPVIGIDKSALRLTRAGKQQVTNSNETPSNVLWIRAELLDFWRLALEKVKAGLWQIPYHAIYYPNPWPKQSEATRRFHLHPIFPTLMQLASTTELRTNWEIYATEFELAAKTLEPLNKLYQPIGAQITREAFFADEPQTAFERKYKEARQQLWRVLVSFNF